MRTKITVVAFSSVGATTAQRIAERDYADVVLVDTFGETARDLNEVGAVLGYEPTVVATDDYAETGGSDIVVITSSHEAAVSENVLAVRSVAEQIKDRSPNSIVITQVRPVGLMCHVVAAVTEFARGRVTGPSESTRLRALVARELGISARDVQALVLGGSGDSAVPLLSCTAVAGIPVRKLLSDERLEEVVRSAREDRVGDPFPLATSAAVAEMVDAIALDQKRMLACAALCQGEYGLDGAFVAVPVVLGSQGIDEIVELDLDDDQRAAVEAAAGRVKQALRAARSGP